MAIETKQYRIPGSPVGFPYYRRGQRYEPGDLVSIPADEIPAGWSLKQKKTDKDGKRIPFPDGKAHPVELHAWKEIVKGKKEQSFEEQTELERARNEAEEAKKAVEDAERRLAELEAKQPPQDEGEGAPKRGIVEDDGEGEEPGTGEEGGKKGKGRKRAADTDL